jgi:predicted DNA-binding transcriptional regulator AlpA
VADDTNDTKRRLWAREAAEYLRVSRSTLAKWRMRGEGPPFHRFGKRLTYYLKGELDQWFVDSDVANNGAVKNDRPG